MAPEEIAGYRFLEHTTDVLVDAWGRNLEEALENAAKALMETMFHVENVREKTEDAVEATGFDRESLLYNWLEAVLVKAMSEGKVYRSFEVEVEREDTGYRLKAKAKGEPVHAKSHMPKVEVKAVTYHLMDVSEGAKRTNLRFLLDI